MEAVITPLQLWLSRNEDVTIEVGQEIREALRRDQLAALHEGLEAIRDAEEAMPAMDEGKVRAGLEDLDRALRWTKTACDALWFLAPEYDDGGAPFE